MKPVCLVIGAGAGIGDDFVEPTCATVKELAVGVQKWDPSGQPLRQGQKEIP